MAQFSVKIIRLNGAVLDENQQSRGSACSAEVANGEAQLAATSADLFIHTS
jgi:hypothetical protein